MKASQLPELLDVWQKSIDWQPNSATLTLFQQLYAEVLAGNRQLNLTRVTEPIDFWEKHLWDSLRGIAPLRDQTDLQLIDIGSGAGFPGLPIAIACPTWQVTLLDSTGKKITFLETLARSLNLPLVQTRCDRVETVGRLWRDRFDLATVRAVAAAVVCAEYALPLLKVGGTAILYRGQWTAEEADAIEQALPLLGGELESIEMFETPITYSIRHCLYLRKVAPTPKDFPRAIGLAVQKPLA